MFFELPGAISLACIGRSVNGYLLFGIAEVVFDERISRFNGAYDRYQRAFVSVDK